MKLLETCLSSLTKQSADSRAFEVVVVDNGSSTDTAELVAAFSGPFPNIRYCLERTTGLSHARNRGMLEATGKYIAYIDDDAVAYPDWVEKILLFIATDDAGVAMFGGPYTAFSTVAIPTWFPHEYGSFSLGENILSLNAVDEFLCGTNMIFRREFLLGIGGFNTELGMVGNTLSYGEETRLQIEIKRSGYEIIYVPAIRVKHLLAPEKMCLSWLLRSVYAVGRCSDTTFCTKRTLASCFASICYGCWHAMRIFFTQRGIPLRRKLFYSLKPLVSEIGALHRLLGSGSVKRGRQHE